MTGNQTVLEREVRIAASPETVFSYFTDPEKLLRWWGIAAAIEPRPGGGFRVDINGRNVASGRYLEIEPPRRIVLSWGWEGAGHPIPPGSTRVEIDFIPVAAPDGGTLLRLRHLGLPADSVADHRSGWQHYGERLALAAAGRDPGPDPWVADGLDREPAQSAPAG
jgi:uncharacterized protein YndB with AHSA1/START domain